MFSENSARPPVGFDKRSMIVLQSVLRRAPSLPDHVQGDIAPLESALHVGDRGVASLIFSVGEHDERLSAGLPAEHAEAAKDDVIERRRAPGGKTIDGLDAIGRVRRAAGQREDGVVESEERDLLPGRAPRPEIP